MQYILVQWERQESGARADRADGRNRGEKRIAMADMNQIVERNQPDDASRQAVYSFFADLFLEPVPVDDEGEGTGFVDDLARRIAAFMEIDGADPAIRASFEAFLAACEGDRAKLQRSIAVDRSALFRATRRTAGPLPPCEGLYRTDRPARATMQDLNAFYARFGSGMAEDVRERPDYLGIELAFMAQLVGATIDAAPENGETEIGLRAQREFVQRHLSLWAPSCCEELARNADTDAMRGLLALLRDFIEEERERFEER